MKTVIAGKVRQNSEVPYVSIKKKLNIQVLKGKDYDEKINCIYSNDLMSDIGCWF